MKKDDALEQAIDDAVSQFEAGEFMKNVVISVKSNGKKVKVVGDVWGTEDMKKEVTTTVNHNVELKVGDQVTFKGSLGKLVEGKIVGMNQTSAIVEHEATLGRMTKSEIRYQDLTKLGN